MDVFGRHRSLFVLILVLFVQVLGLAVQVRRPTEAGPTRLIRLWGVSLITPAENTVVHAQDWMRNIWRSYFYLRDVRRENEQLQEENLKLRLEQVRLAEDAGQAQRLQVLLKFKEQFISETVAAQVIGSSGSEQSRVLYIDKGSADGIKLDMAVITPAGIIGKIVRVFPNIAQVLEINDQSSGVGAILEKSRLQGIVKGTPAGEIMVHYVMADEKVEPGEMVLTSGGDRIFPKGLPIGQVTQVNPGPETFLNIRVKPVAPLDRLEEVLVITRVLEKEPESLPQAPLRAAEILAQRLPGVPPKPPAANPSGPTAQSAAPPGSAAESAAGTAATAPGAGALTASPVHAPAGAKPASAVAAAGTKPVPPGTPAEQRVSAMAATASPKVASPAKTPLTGQTKTAVSPVSNPPKPPTAAKPNAAPNTASAAPLNPVGVKAVSDGGSLKPKKPVAQNQTATPTKDNPQ